MAVKVFLEHDGRLLILKDSFGQWDLPGGRIKRNEFDTPLIEVLKRKLGEELGPDITYSVRPSPEIFMRHRRQEKVDGEDEARIFALGFLGLLKTGTIQLSPAHVELKWVHPESFDPQKYFTGGWLNGVQQYIQLKAKQPD